MNIRHLFFCLTALTFGLHAQAQYTFDPEVTSGAGTPTITYNSGTGVFQYTDAASSSNGNASLTLAGSVATIVTTSDGWTASVTVNLSARSMTATSTLDPWDGIALAFTDSSRNNYVAIELAQVNYTGGTNSDVPNYYYGTVVELFTATNGVRGGTTPLGNGQAGSTDSYLTLTGGTSLSLATESISEAYGVVTLNYDATTKIITGYYNGSPMGSYSTAGWSSGLQLALVVEGTSGQGSTVSADTATANNFSVSFPSLYFQNGTSLGILSLNTTFLPSIWAGIGGMGAGWQQRAVADVNGDGIPDIIFQNGTQIGALIMNANGTPKSWAGIGSMNSGWELCGAADITNDGHLDLIFQNGTLLGYLEVNSSAQPVSWTGIGAMSTGWELRAVASLDGTGQPDLIFQNGTLIGALRVNASGVPTAWTGIGAMNAGWTLSDAVDVNGDGQPDLIFQNGTSLGALQVNTSFQPVAWHGIGAMGSGWTLPGDY